MMDRNNKEFDKEEIRKFVEKHTLWKDISNEWRISTNSDLTIDINFKGNYHVSVECGNFSISDEFRNFDDAWSAIDRLHEVMVSYLLTYRR